MKRKDPAPEKNFPLEDDLLREAGITDLEEFFGKPDKFGPGTDSEIIFDLNPREENRDWSKKPRSRKKVTKKAKKAKKSVKTLVKRKRGPKA